MTQHTPGPWQAVEPRRPFAAGEGYSIRTKPFGKTNDNWNGYIASVLRTSPNAEANARLIAAAPDMLEALDAARIILMNRDQRENEMVVYRAICAIIAKATGEA